MTSTSSYKWNLSGAISVGLKIALHLIFPNTAMPAARPFPVKDSWHFLKNEVDRTGEICLISSCGF